MKAITPTHTKILAEAALGSETSRKDENGPRREDDSEHRKLSDGWPVWTKSDA
jgi:hypothetical protein